LSIIDTGFGSASSVGLPINGGKANDFLFLLYIALISYHPLKLSRSNRAISFPRQKILNKSTSITQKINYSDPTDFMTPLIS